MINNMIQESCTCLFQIKHLVVYWKFLQQIIFFLKTFNSEFHAIEVWFRDQNSLQLEVEDKKKFNFSN